MSHVTHTNESCVCVCVCVCVRVCACVWRMRHVTQTNESCRTRATQWGNRQNESYDTYEWVMSHQWMSHVKQANESCHTNEWVMPHKQMSHVTWCVVFYGTLTCAAQLIRPAQQATPAGPFVHTTKHCNTLQHTATHCNILQHLLGIRTKGPCNHSLVV